MGCDIHLYVEVLNQGSWVSADNWKLDDGEITVSFHDRFYDGRNYDLFAILANVRNGKGFAGVKTGDGFKPISMPRGLPADVCQEIAKESAKWGIDGHSHSWLTVKELLSYDWTQVTKSQGWVNGLEYYKWQDYNEKRGESPNSYSGEVTGISVKHISRSEMDDIIANLKKPFSGKTGWYNEFIKIIEDKLSKTYCLVSWDVPYYKASRSFLSDTLPRLWSLGDPKNVRIVFWFDN